MSAPETEPEKPIESEENNKEDDKSMIQSKIRYSEGLRRNTPRRYLIFERWNSSSQQNKPSNSPQNKSSDE